MKKTHFLQTLYLQKPLLLILLIAALSTLPWIGLGDFYTKGEPREAGLAISMIEKGEWVVPSSYADEFAYKPPLNHWMIAGFSLLFNNGEVTPFTSRLPSAIAFVGMIGVCFMYFGRRRSTLEAFVACLIVITCFEIHRAAMTTRVDMVLTFFMVTGIIQLFVWYEKKKFIYLLSTWLLLGLATLAKGPVGILLPCLIFGAYQLTQKENFFKAILRCVIVALPSLIIPFVWYYSAYQIKGEEFYDRMFYENVARFLRIQTKNPNMGYDLGVENPWYYYPVTLIAGFIPWTITLLISLFFIKYKLPKEKLISYWNKFLAMDKLFIYALIAIVGSLMFFTVPASKRSVYIMLIYPFIAIFMARFFIYLAEMKPKAIKISTSILIGIASLLFVTIAMCFLRIINLEDLSHHISNKERTLYDIKLFSDLFRSPGLLGFIIIGLLLIAIVNSIVLLRKKMNIKILMAGFGLMLVINLLMDAYLLPAFKDAYSTREFAEQISTKYDLKGKTYVTNNLVKYRNLYGLNFYLHNNFININTMPHDGYFVALERDSQAIFEEYSNYNFVLLESSDKSNEYRNEMCLYKISKN